VSIADPLSEDLLGLLVKSSHARLGYSYRISVLLLPLLPNRRADRGGGEEGRKKGGEEGRGRATPSTWHTGPAFRERSTYPARPRITTIVPTSRWPPVPARGREGGERKKKKKKGRTRRDYAVPAPSLLYADQLASSRRVATLITIFAPGNPGRPEERRARKKRKRKGGKKKNARFPAFHLSPSSSPGRHSHPGTRFLPFTFRAATLGPVAGGGGEKKKKKKKKKKRKEK